MIGGSNPINSYGAHNHEHMVTKCLHESHAVKPEGGGPMNGAGRPVVMQEMQKQETFSIKDILLNGWKSLYNRTFGLVGRIWDSEGKEDGAGRSGDRAVWTEADHAVGQQGAVTGVIQQQPSENAAAGILSTAVVRTVEERENTVHEETERKVGSVESAVSGGLKKEQGGVKKFLQKFGGTVARTGRLWRRERETETEASLAENNTDFGVGDGSYLLDSYNKSGEYSTLASGRSLEGNFKARG